MCWRTYLHHYLRFVHLKIIFYQVIFTTLTLKLNCSSKISPLRYYLNSYLSHQNIYCMHYKVWADKLLFSFLNYPYSYHLTILMIKYILALFKSKTLFTFGNRFIDICRSIQCAKKISWQSILFLILLFIWRHLSML